MASRWLHVFALDQANKYRKLGLFQLLAHPLALMISAVSAVTTYIGFSSVLKSVAAALIITIAVQAILYVVSMNMGRAWRIGNRPQGMMLLAFLMSLGFSSGFSFVAFYQEFTGGGKADQTGEARMMAEASRDAAREKLDAMRDEAQKKLKDNPEFAPFVASMRESATTISANWEKARLEAEKTLAEQRKAQAEAEAQKKFAAASKEEAEALLPTIRAEAEAAQKRVADARGVLTTTEARIADLRTRENFFKEQAKMEESQGLEGRISGCGPKCREFQAEAKKVAQNRQLEEATLSGQKQALRDAETALSQVKTRVDALNKQIAEAAVKAVDAPSAVATIPTTNSVPLEKPEDLSALLVDFQTRPTLAALRTLQTSCKSFSETLQKVGSPALVCSADRLAAAITRLGEIEEAQTAFKDKCGSKAVDGLGFEEGIALARTCVSEAKLLSGESGPLYEAISALERNYSKDTAAATLAWAALLSGKSLAAVLAFLMAVMVDLLVLAIGFLAEDENKAALSAEWTPKAEEQRKEILDLLPKTLGGTPEESRRRALAILDAAQIPKKREILLDLTNARKIMVSPPPSPEELQALRIYIGKLGVMGRNVREKSEYVWSIPINLVRAFGSMREENVDEPTEDPSGSASISARKRVLVVDPYARERGVSRPFDLEREREQAQGAGEPESRRTASIKTDASLNSTGDKSVNSI